MDVTIRRARESDREGIIAAKYTEPEPEIRAIVKTRRGALTIGRLLTAHRIEAAPAKTSVAEFQGKVVGFIETSLPGQYVAPGPVTFARVLFAGLFRLGPVAVIRYMRFRRVQASVDIDRAPGSHYVAHLNVHPKCRSRGVGAALLAEAERQACEAGLKRLSLTMYVTNPAQHLYERAGYRVVETRTDAAFERLVGVPGYALMVKELE